MPLKNPDHEWRKLELTPAEKAARLEADREMWRGDHERFVNERLFRERHPSEALPAARARRSEPEALWLSLRREVIALQSRIEGLCASNKVNHDRMEATRRRENELQLQVNRLRKDLEDTDNTLFASVTHLREKIDAALVLIEQLAKLGDEEVSTRREVIERLRIDFANQLRAARLRP